MSTKQSQTALLNGATLNSHAIARPSLVAPLESAAPRTVARTGQLNSFMLNTAVFNAASTSSSDAPQTAITRPIRAVLRGHTLNRVTLNKSGVRQTLVEGGTSQPAIPRSVRAVLLGHTLNRVTLNKSGTMQQPGTGEAIAVRDVVEELAAAAGTFTSGQNIQEAVADAAQALGTLTPVVTAFTLVEETPAATDYVGVYRTSYESVAVEAQAAGTSTSVTVRTSTVEDTVTAGYTDSARLEAVNRFEGTATASDQVLRTGLYYLDLLDDLATVEVELLPQRIAYYSGQDVALIAGYLDTVVRGLGRVVDQAAASDEVVREGVSSTLSDTIQDVASATSTVSSTLYAVQRVVNVAVATASTGAVALGECWVFNTNTGAMSRYEGTGAFQYVSQGGEILAATDRGIAVEDSSKSAQAYVDFGLKLLGSQQLKSLRHYYVTLSADKPPKFTANIVKPAPGGRKLVPIEYAARTIPGYIPNTQRIDLLRKPRSTYWGFKLIADEDANTTFITSSVMYLTDSRRV